MRTKRINGTQFEQMIKNGLINIRNHEIEINNANVFPVPDGDTGTNMALTLENGIKYAISTTDLGKYLKDLSEKMLLGARGNSGVILSQIFKGFALSLESDSIANVSELTDALIRGYKSAYNAVVRPVEGTILTVAREGIEHIINQLRRDVYIENLFAMYLAEMRKSLSYTPEILPMLKEAGVVDSGAMGYIYIVEGMVRWLYGEILIGTNTTREIGVSTTPSDDLSFFNENSAFGYGYCMEFILQLMNGDKYLHHFRTDSFIEELKLYGNSIVCIKDKTRVKVHIHTMLPGKVIASSQEYGEFVSFKLENMQLQHNEYMMKINEIHPHKSFAIIAVANGEGIKSLMKDLGCDFVIDGGQTMNTSTQEFINAFKTVNADNVVVFPNNKNIIGSAAQAVEIYGKSKVTIIPTESIAEGYYGLAMDVGDSDDSNYRINMMKQGIVGVITLAVTRIIRDSICNGITCKKGDFVLLYNGMPISSGTDYVSIITEGIKNIKHIENKETCLVFTGDNFKTSDEDKLKEIMQEILPDLQIDFVNGGQSIYDLIIGII